jgi:hypothetical protein
MHVEIEVELTERGGVPQARVSREKAWDLVDYLANQRVQVTYSFEAERLLVNFHHMSVQSARELLDHWQQAAEREASQLAHSSHQDHADQWLVGAKRNA